MAHMTPEEFAKYEAEQTSVIDIADYTIDNEAMEVIIDKMKTKDWSCDECGWESKDKALVPKFCAKYGLPFDNSKLT
ncbi:MAG: hypothetical protein GX270_13865 [Clostridiaceae bacterium]|nr:hypothetical protein [Clostridiaceae bacterium]